MAADPERRLADLTSLLEAEQEQLNGHRDAPQDPPNPADLDLDRFNGDQLDPLIAQLR
jgi:hypothetical protein